MNKEQFNQLDIVEQMQYINDLLKTMSLTKACENIGIDRATVRKRFKSKEISFNKDLNKYVFDIPVEKYGVKPSKESVEAKIKPVKRAVNNNINLDSMKLLEEKIKALESQIEATNKRIDSLETTKTTINTTTDTTINTYDGKEVVRSFRVNEGVQQRFKNYCKANVEHKVSDILSSILDEYLKSQGY